MTDLNLLEMALPKLQETLGWLDLAFDNLPDGQTLKNTLSTMTKESTDIMDAINSASARDVLYAISFNESYEMIDDIEDENEGDDEDGNIIEGSGYQALLSASVSLREVLAYLHSVKWEALSNDPKMKNTLDAITTDYTEKSFFSANTLRDNNNVFSFGRFLLNLYAMEYLVKNTITVLRS